jgi:hypothetical protein
MKKQCGTKRSLFAELIEGIDSMKTFRERRIALKTCAIRRSKRELARVAQGLKIAALL